VNIFTLELDGRVEPGHDKKRVKSMTIGPVTRAVAATLLYDGVLHRDGKIANNRKLFL